MLPKALFPSFVPVLLASLLMAAGCGVSHGPARGAGATASAPEAAAPVYDAWERIEERPSRLAVDPDEITADADMAAFLVPYTEGIAHLREQIVHNAQTLTRSRGDGGPAGDWLADVMRDRAERVMGREVRFAIANAGGVRADLSEGPVTTEDLFQVMPFDNTLVVYELSPEDMARFAEFLATRGGYFPLSGGVLEKRGDEPARFLVDGEVWQPDGPTLVATNSYIAGGGDDADIFATFPEPTDSETFIRDMMVDWAQELAAQGGEITMPENRPRYRLDN